MKFVGATHDEHLKIKPVHPPLRLLPEPTPLHITSPLCQARDLKHKKELETMHKLDIGDSENRRGGRIDDEDTEENEKTTLLALKQWVGDEVTTSSWDMDSPLKSWRRVRTNKGGTFVEGLSLVSTRK